MFAGLMSRCTSPALWSAASPAHDSSDDLPQLEERHEPRRRVLLQVGADQVLEHEERHARRRRRGR